MTGELGRDDKPMKLRYAGTCRLCGTELAAGTPAIYERSFRTVRCAECGPDNTVTPGTAGASARREYERRKDRREQRIRENHPKIGGLILALSDDAQTTRSWERGAIGEELLAQRLTELPDTFRVLHDRRIPRTRANIDHIVIGPTGVWVVDAKRYKGKRPALRVEGGIFRPRVESLRVAGRDSAKLVRGVQSQVSIVTAAVDLPTVPVHGVLCFLEADWPLVGGSFTVDGVHAVWPRLLIKRMMDAPQHPIDVAALTLRIAAVLPVA